ncbi:MAG: hypothetical protein FJ304_26750 [Planctomycetes bacterium]|nr:hypothetical protein [Planctomycetota bacterium]
MARNRMLSRLVLCAAAVVLLGAAQPPNEGPPALPPVPTTPPSAQPTEPRPNDPFVPLPAPIQPQAAQPRQFKFKIEPNTPVKDLLPVAPKVAPVTGPVLTDDLKAVPEITFAAPNEKRDPTAAAAHQIAKINHMNAKKADAFMAALIEARPELGGMPFAMGDDCRTSGDRLKHFTQAAQSVRTALGGGRVQQAPNAPVLPSFRSSSTGQAGGTPQAAQTFRTAPTTNFIPTGDVQQVLFIAGQEPFWRQYTELCDLEDSATRRDKATAEHVTVARVAALTQMLAVESPEIRLGLVKYLAGVPHVDATKALARMAIYSAEADIRDAAVTSLKVRREKDYTDVLVSGLKYPWPAVAKRAAEAITKLERTDLLPHLLAMLEATDPRLPSTKEVSGKKVMAVREMVKMNHHRNCLMCHAPNGSGTPNPNALTAEVAIQGQPLPLPSEGYRQSSPELMVRLDVTYLRQDFSVAMHVKDAHPWPEEQRFDFFVRERVLTDAEATAYREQLAPKEAGVLSPYHKAAVTALRELTGKDAAPTAEAWRKLLDTPRRD